MTDYDRRIASLERAMRGVPSRFAGGGAAAVVPLPWVGITARGGNNVITVPSFVFGVKRFAGEAKADGWKFAPRRATATCTVLAGAVNTVTVTDPGLCYSVLPVVTVSPPPVGITAVLTPTLAPTSGSVEGCYITACGAGYDFVAGTTTVAFTAAPPGGVTATGTVTVRDGLVVGITMTNKGRGYLVAPIATITDAGAPPGAGAAATAVLGQAGISLAITTPGTGYVAAPTITIAIPTAQPVPLPTSGAPWPDGLGWGVINGGSLTGGYSAGLADLIVHDDRGMVAYGLMGDGAGTVPYSRAPDSILSWYRTLVRLTIADANADGVLPAWVPMSGGL